CLCLMLLALFRHLVVCSLFFTLSLHDALPISFIETMVERGGFEPAYLAADQCDPFLAPPELDGCQPEVHVAANMFLNWGLYGNRDRKSTRLNSSHVKISYAVFCLKKKNHIYWF